MPLTLPILPVTCSSWWKHFLAIFLLPLMLEVLGSAQTTSATAAPLQAATFTDVMSKQTPYVDVRVFGAKCDGKTVDDPAINAASEFAAKSGGTLFIPSGLTCKVAKTVVVTSNMMAVGATLSTSADIVVLRVGTRNADLLNKTLWLPNTTNLAGRWSGSVSTGVEILNADSCRIMEGDNLNFLVGTKVSASRDRGATNNTIFIGREENDKVGYLLQAEDPTGWVNQNTFYGGRIGLYSNECLARGIAGTVTAGSRVVRGLPSTAQLRPGMRVIVGPADPAQSPAPTFPDGATISSVDGATQITLSGSASYSGRDVPLIFPVPGTRQVQMTTTGPAVNSNQFVGLDLEGECAEYQAELNSAAYNTFLGVRWESEAPRVKLTGSSTKPTQGNMWINGLYLFLLQVWDDPFTGGNSIEAPDFRTLIGRGLLQRDPIERA